MKLAILTSFVLLVSLVSTSTAVPTPEASHSFEARSEELEARAPDEAEAAVLYAKRGMMPWLLGGAAVALGLHAWNKSKQQGNAGAPQAAGNSISQQPPSYSSTDPNSNAGTGGYKRDLSSDTFGGLD